MQQARKLSANRPVRAPQPKRDPVARPQPERRLKKIKMFLILTACFLLSLAVVAQYSSLVILNYRLSSSRAELAELKEISRALEVEIAGLSSIGRIEQIARNELGMVDPEIGQLNVITARHGSSNRPGE